MDQRTIFLGHLPTNVNKEMLHEACIPFGEIMSIDIPVDPRTRAPKGYAFVEFEEDEDASQAVDNLHLGQFYGKTIRVSFARIGQRQQAMTVHVLARRAVWEQEDYLKERTTANHPVELTDASQA